MRALKWAAGIALGNDLDDSRRAFGSARGRVGNNSGVWQSSATSNEDGDFGSQGRPHAGGVAATQAVGPRVARGEGGWMNDDSSASCLLCDTPFTFTNRRHHCRQCLKLVCSACSSNMWQLDSGRSRGAAGRRAGFKRVCDQCYAALVAAREVLVGGDTTTLDSGEHMHFEVIVHETLGRSQTPRGNTPPAVPVGPSSPRPELGAGCAKTWTEADRGSTSGSPVAGSVAPAEAAPRLPGSDTLNRARAPYCRLTVANKQVGKTRPISQPVSAPSAAAVAAVAADVDAGRQRFEQHFLFRVSCACRTADYLVLEVYDRAGGLSTGADPLLGHCRVPLFRTRRNCEYKYWHMLLEPDDAAGAVGRALVTVRNLGAGSIPRPAWGASVPGAVLVPPPAKFTPQASRATWHSPDRGGYREEPGERQFTVSPEADGSEPAGRDARRRADRLPDNPLLLDFFPRGSKKHEALFFRVGAEDGDVLPVNERALEVFPRVLMRPRMGHTTSGGGVSSSSASGHGGGKSPAPPPSGGTNGGSSSGHTYYPGAAGVDSWGVGGLGSALSSVISAPSAVAVAAAVGARSGAEASPGGTSTSRDVSSSGSAPGVDVTRGAGRGKVGSEDRRSSGVAAAVAVVDGALLLTTHRVIFVERRVGDGDAGELVEIPLAFIVETRVKRRSNEGLACLQIECRDTKMYHFAVSRGSTRAEDAILLHAVRRFEDEIAWLIEEDNFAHSSDTSRADASLDERGETLALDPDINPFLDVCDPSSTFSKCTRGYPSGYHPALEHQRQGIDESNDWAYSGVNRRFRLCPTYGRYLVVPSALDEVDIRKASKWRSRCRIPALTWLHPVTGAAMCRSSQPMTGLGLNPSSPEDEQLLTAIRAAADSAANAAQSASRAASSSGSLSPKPRTPTPAARPRNAYAGQDASPFDEQGRPGRKLSDAEAELGRRRAASSADVLTRGSGARKPDGKREKLAIVVKGLWTVGGRDLRLLTPGIKPMEPSPSPTGSGEADRLAAAQFSTELSRQDEKPRSRSRTDVNYGELGLVASRGDERKRFDFGDPAASRRAKGVLENSTSSEASGARSRSPPPLQPPLPPPPPQANAASTIAAELQDAIISPVTDILISRNGSTAGSGGTLRFWGSKGPLSLSRSGAASVPSRASCDRAGTASRLPRLLRHPRQMAHAGASEVRSVTSDGGRRSGEGVLMGLHRSAGALPSRAGDLDGLAVESGPREERYSAGGSGLEPFSEGLQERNTQGGNARAGNAFVPLGTGAGSAAEAAMMAGAAAGATAPTKSCCDQRDSAPTDGLCSADSRTDPGAVGMDEVGSLVGVYGGDDVDDDVESLSSSSVTSVSSAPGNQTRPSSMSDSAIFRATAAATATVIASVGSAPRPSSGPASPSAAHGGSRGRTAMRSDGTGGDDKAPLRSRQRALSVPTDLAAALAAAQDQDGEPSAAGGGPTPRTAVLRIVDARPIISAKGNLIMGKGHEVISRLGGHRHASLTFLEIPNVHVMQQSFSALMAACCAREDDPAWLVNLHNSRWLEYVGALLKGASDVMARLEAGDPVLVHCSDGWDRTSQLTSLAQLLLDPYYRTIDGFQVLVSKDWCAFGHRFAARGGHGRDPSGESSPIFPQFLDATHQLLRQFPTLFEFSEDLLLLLLHAYHSRWFNDFLHNSEYERALAHARSESAVGGGDITVSVWSHVRYCRERYENVLWTEQRTEQGGGGIFGGEAASFSGDISGEGDPFCYSGVDAGVGETRAPDDEARLWRPGRRHLPPPLWPACGVRSLVVWQRAWACRGLEHPGSGRLHTANCVLEETLYDVIRRQQSTIRGLSDREATDTAGNEY